MWRLWDTDSQGEQQWDNSTSEGIPVLASGSDDSVVFVAKKPLPSNSNPRLLPGLPADALPTFSSSASDTSSSLGEY